MIQNHQGGSYTCRLTRVRRPRTTAESPGISKGAPLRARAKFEEVLAHYAQGFISAGYAHVVISATAQEEQHLFRRGVQSFTISLLRAGGYLLEVQMKTLSGQGTPQS